MASWSTESRGPMMVLRPPYAGPHSKCLARAEFRLAPSFVCPAAGREALRSSPIRRPNRGRGLCPANSLRTQRAGRIIGSLNRVGIALHQDADLLATTSVRIIDLHDFAGAGPEGQHRSVGMFENPGDFMRRHRGIERRRLCRGGRARAKWMPAEAENRQLLIARHKHPSIRHDRHDIGVEAGVGP